MKQITFSKQVVYEIFSGVKNSHLNAKPQNTQAGFEFDNSTIGPAKIAKQQIAYFFPRRI